MPRQKPADKLADLQKKMAQLKAQEQALLARSKDQERKDDTRRKVIVGALALEHMEKNAESDFGKTLARLLKEYVKPRDQSLFPALFAPLVTNADELSPEESEIIDRNLENRRGALAALAEK